jgi:hypothetical protein
MSQTKTNSEVVAVATEVKQLGRPVNTNSVRQQKLAKVAELKAQGVEIKRGRKPVETSKNQTKKARFEALRAQGVEIRRGRPKMIKAEVVNVEAVVEN